MPAKKRRIKKRKEMMKTGVRNKAIALEEHFAMTQLYTMIWREINDDDRSAHKKSANDSVSALKTFYCLMHLVRSVMCTLSGDTMISSSGEREKEREQEDSMRRGSPSSSNKRS